MNRLDHLRETLPANLAANSDYADLEFVLLNYNSTDEMEEWVMDTFSHEIKSGRVVYVRENTARFFKPAHSRNVCARMASGEVICNVDADNFTGQGFASFLTAEFSDPTPAIANTYDLYEYKELCTHGRIAIRRWHFYKMGGYDENQVGWGGEDGDLNRRCLAAGFRRIVIPPMYLQYIDHDERVRLQLIDLGNADDLTKAKETTNRANWMRSSDRVRNKMFVANVGRVWGKAVVKRNYSDEIKLETTWVGNL